MKRGSFSKQICWCETLADYRENIWFSPRFFIDNIYFHESFRENVYVKDNSKYAQQLGEKWAVLQKFEFV